MPLVVECPSCGKKLSVPDQLVGQVVRCADCAGTFTAQRRSPSSVPSRGPERRERDDGPDEDDDRYERPSRRRSRRRDGGDYFAPHRGGLIMTLGIISLALILIEVFGYF